MAADKKQLIQTFLRTVGHDVRHYQALLPLLKTQRKLYLTFDADLLSANTQQQQPLLNALKRSALERSTCLKQLGLSQDDAGVQRLLSVLPQSLGQQIKTQWSTLQSLVQQCQQCNAENGHTSASFHEMLSQMNVSTTHTYQESQP